MSCHYISSNQTLLFNRRSLLCILCSPSQVCGMFKQSMVLYIMQSVTISMWEKHGLKYQAQADNGLMVTPYATPEHESL